jgi:hypothetical protein
MVVIWWRAHSDETRTRFKAERSGSFVNLARMSCWSELDLYKVVDLVAMAVDEVWIC